MRVKVSSLKIKKIKMIADFKRKFFINIINSSSISSNTKMMIILMINRLKNYNKLMKKFISN